MAEEEQKTETEAAPPAKSGGGGWIPLIVSILLMPALAFVMTQFVILPRLQKSLGASASSGEAEHSSESGATKVNARESGKAKTKVPLSKLVVNVSGSLGTRLLLTSLTLAGSSTDFKTRLEENTDQLRDLAASVLASKTIADLEKPEARNLIRAELLSQFNTVLGNGFVQEVYITEFAIQ